MNDNRFSGMIGRFTVLVISLILPAAFWCCTGSNVENGSPMPTVSKKSTHKVALTQVRSAPMDYEKKVVTVSGGFRGWKGRCPSSFAVTRSDWILDDGQACIYVSGKLPSGVSVTNPNNENVTVTGQIRLDQGGRMNLKAMEVIKTP